MPVGDRSVRVSVALARLVLVRVPPCYNYYPYFLRYFTRTNRLDKPSELGQTVFQQQQVRRFNFKLFNMGPTVRYRTLPLSPGAACRLRLLGVRFFISSVFQLKSKVIQTWHLLLSSYHQSRFNFQRNRNQEKAVWKELLKHHVSIV